MLGQIANRLETYMDLLSRRQQILAANVANADTPGYRTSDIDFQSELETAFAQNQPPKPRPIEVEGLTVKNDGNNVSLQREAQLLGETAVRFNVASNFMRGEIRQIRSAIKGGGQQ